MPRRRGFAPPGGEITRNALAWVFGVVLVYSIMFATGALLFGQHRKLAVFGTLLRPPPHMTGNSHSLTARSAR